MDFAEFEDLLGRLGSDMSSWPADRRDQAALLLRSSEQARAALAEAELIRDALRSPPVLAPSGLLDRIMQKVQSSDKTPTGKSPADKPPTKRDGN
jgi:hypothetical protein